jgi:hypothetical protein
LNVWWNKIDHNMSIKGVNVTSRLHTTTTPICKWDKIGKFPMGWGGVAVMEVALGIS